MTSSKCAPSAFPSTIKNVQKISEPKKVQR